MNPSLSCGGMGWLLGPKAGLSQDINWSLGHDEVELESQWTPRFGGLGLFCAVKAFRNIPLNKEDGRGLLGDVVPSFVGS